MRSLLLVDSNIEPFKQEWYLFPYDKETSISDLFNLEHDKVMVLIDSVNDDLNFFDKLNSFLKNQEMKVDELYVELQFDIQVDLSFVTLLNPIRLFMSLSLSLPKIGDRCQHLEI